MKHSALNKKPGIAAGDGWAVDHPETQIYYYFKCKIHSL